MGGVSHESDPTRHMATWTDAHHARSQPHTQQHWRCGSLPVIANTAIQFAYHMIQSAYRIGNHGSLRRPTCFRNAARSLLFRPLATSRSGCDRSSKAEAA
jgi:hypothetical protein